MNWGVGGSLVPSGPQRPSLHGPIRPVGPETNLTGGCGRLHRAGHRREGLTVQVQQAGLLQEGPRGLELGSTGRGGRQLVMGRGRGARHSQCRDARARPLSARSIHRPGTCPSSAAGPLPASPAPAPSPRVCPHLAGRRGPLAGGLLAPGTTNCKASSPWHTAKTATSLPVLPKAHRSPAVTPIHQPTPGRADRA